jgi:hypothetical protein
VGSDVLRGQCKPDAARFDGSGSLTALVPAKRSLGMPYLPNRAQPVARTLGSACELTTEKSPWLHSSATMQIADPPSHRFDMSDQRGLDFWVQEDSKVNSIVDQCGWCAH